MLGWGLIAGIVLVLASVLIGIFGIIGHFAFGWFQAGVDIVSPTNVKAQYARAYTNYESMKATAGNVCAAQKLVATETNPSIKAQRQDQLLAYQATYRSIQANYDEAYDNAFEAAHVGPSDLPRPAPGLDQMLIFIGCS